MSSLGELAVGATVEVFLGAVALGLLYRIWGKFLPLPRKQRVLAFQRGVLLRGAQVERVLSPGDYRIRSNRTLLLCDMRNQPFEVPAQILVSLDGQGLRMRFGGELRVADPELFITQSKDSFSSFHVELRQAIRLAVGEMSADSLLSGGAALTARVTELLLPRAALLGVEIAQLNIWEIVPVGWL